MSAMTKSIDFSLVRNEEIKLLPAPGMLLTHREDARGVRALALGTKAEARTAIAAKILPAGAGRAEACLVNSSTSSAATLPVLPVLPVLAASGLEEKPLVLSVIHKAEADTSDSDITVVSAAAVSAAAATAADKVVSARAVNNVSTVGTAVTIDTSIGLDAGTDNARGTVAGIHQVELVSEPFETKAADMAADTLRADTAAMESVGSVEGAAIEAVGGTGAVGIAQSGRTVRPGAGDAALAVGRVSQDRTFGAQLKRTMGLFWPVFMGMLAATAMGVTDTVMAGAAGTVELSGVAIGSSVFWPAELFVAGLALGIHPLIARLSGADKLEKIPEQMQLAAMVCIVMGIIAGGVIMTVPLLYDLLLDIPADMLAVGQGYLIATGLALPGFACFNVLRAYWEGMGRTRPTMFFGCMALLINIPLNWIFIFGHFGMPALGGIGCGVASCLSVYLTDLAMLCYVLHHRSFARCRIMQRWYRFSFREYFSFVRFALPLGVAAMVETLCFSLVAVLLGPLGPAEVAGHTVAMNVSGLLVIVPAALSAVASVEIGEAMGTSDIDSARQRARSSLTIALFFYAVGLMVIILGTEQIVGLYSDDPEVMLLAPVLLWYCGIMLLPDTLQLIAAGILRGFKESRVIFRITVISYWMVGMPVGCLLGYGILSDAYTGAEGFWIGFICALSCAALLLLLRAVKMLGNLCQTPKRAVIC